MKYLQIAILWTTYCALHSYLISIGFTNFVKHILKKYYAFYRIIYVALSIVLLIPLMNFSSHIDNNLIITGGPVLTIVRYTLFFGSVLIFIWAFLFSYDFLTFFGIRQITGLLKKEKKNHTDEIKKGGLLGIIRHPMYFAVMIYLWSQTYTTADIVANTVLTIYIIIGTILEERKLVLEFGEAYVRYQREVPMLIPFTKTKTRKVNQGKLKYNN
jgi:methanethiol S-methyltransferase